MKIYTFNDKVLTHNSKWLKEYEQPTPPTPSLPPYTIRMRFTEGVTPSFEKGTLTQVSSSPNIWDLTYENSNWGGLCLSQDNIVEVIDANATGVTAMDYMFYNSSIHTVNLPNTSNVLDMTSMFQYSAITSVQLLDTSAVTNMYTMFDSCTFLTSIPLFNTSNVTNMDSMFKDCGSLTSVPLFDTSKVTDMNYAFQNCYNVQSGALALYQQASTQTTPPESHWAAFDNCGRDTVTGAAELAQIPSDWT